MSLLVKEFARVDDLSPRAWQDVSVANFPFADAAFLRALEVSGAVGGESGWQPRYLTAWNGPTLAGLSYLYAKTNSHGEYIFDWSWADAYRRHGVPYYPKLTAAVPFTPATGPKFLFAPGVNRAEIAARLIARALEIVKEEGFSSLHYLFITPEEVPYFEAAGFFIRRSFQYHWVNRGYESFEGFLAALKPKRRKQIERERSQLAATGLEIKMISGEDLRPEHAVLFHQLYLSTIAKMRAIPYLNLEFFETVFRTMKFEVLLVLAEDQGAKVAGSLFYFKGTNLYGRYWGAFQDVRNLHFELCYYRPLEWAIARKLQRFEAGAQGEHKLARGFLPELTFSAHWLEHPAFCQAIGHFVAEEEVAIQEHFEALKPHHPYVIGK